MLEHATATMYIRGISRSVTHELVRHRHFSFSQLSQRFVHSGDAQFVMPDAVAEDDELSRLVEQAVDDSREHADVEMRRLAVECLRLLHQQAPSLFSDFHVSTLSDGTHMAVSPYA